MSVHYTSRNFITFTGHIVLLRHVEGCVRPNLVLARYVVASRRLCSPEFGIG
jgi:hypothetical protein